MKTVLTVLLGFFGGAALYVAVLISYFSHMATEEMPVLVIILSLWMISLPLFALAPVAGALGAVAASALVRVKRASPVTKDGDEAAG